MAKTLDCGFCHPASPHAALPRVFTAEHGSQHEDQPPVLLLHGFDSSSLEFRRLLPLLEKSLETWAVDLVGWGFSNSGAANQPSMKLGPEQKRDHLYAFWKEKVMICTVCCNALGAYAACHRCWYDSACSRWGKAHHGKG